MKTLPLPRWSGLLICTAALFSWYLPTAADAREGFEWKPLQIEGHDYLSAEQIGQFYELDVTRPEQNKVVLGDGKKVRIILEVGSPVCEMNHIKFVFETPVKEAEGQAQVSRKDLSRVLDPVLRPKVIETSGPLETVILDPAYGGDDHGPANENDSASSYTLEIAKRAAKFLETTGCKVVLTRDDDVAVTPEKRLELANAVEGNSVFVRIHFGSAEDDKRGIATVPLAFRGDVLGEDEATGDRGRESMALASAVHGSAFVTLKPYMVDLGIQPSSDPVYSKVKHPAILLDVGSPGDPEDAKLLHNDAYRERLAKSIGQGIMRYKKATEK